MEFRHDDNIEEILLRSKKKSAYIILHSGKEYYGIIKEIGLHCLVLEQTAGRDYYDAIIRIADISSVEIQVRGL